jgi:rod shape-determining protein MreC
LDEVLVITSTQPRFSQQQQQDLATSEALKGTEAEAIKEQQKASQIMAERLPGLTDANLPPANPASAQPGANPPAPVPEQGTPKPLHPLHPDRFSPGSAPAIVPDASPKQKLEAPTNARPKPVQDHRTSARGGSATRPPQTKPARKP